MSYIVPDGDNVVFNFGDQYSAPNGENVVLNFGQEGQLVLLCNLQTTDITTEGWTASWEVCE